VARTADRRRNGGGASAADATTCTRQSSGRRSRRAAFAPRVLGGAAEEDLDGAGVVLDGQRRHPLEREVDAGGEPFQEDVVQHARLRALDPHDAAGSVVEVTVRPRGDVVRLVDGFDRASGRVDPERDPVLRAHFVTMPQDLTEAARMDGANLWQLFRHVHVPLARPAVSSLAILLFLWTWNQFLLAIVLVDDPAKRTMAGALGAFQGQWGTDIPLLCAGSLLILGPTPAGTVAGWGRRGTHPSPAGSG
jgi:hypothetical protein